MVIKKTDGSQFVVEGNQVDTAVLRMVVDGYNAPLTGGNIVDLVDKGFYDGKVVSCEQ